MIQAWKDLLGHMIVGISFHGLLYISLYQTKNISLCMSLFIIHSVTSMVDLFITVKVPLDGVEHAWKSELGPHHIRTVAEHYGIYKDLFGLAYFYPTTDMEITFPLDDESVIPVCRGNVLEPVMVGSLLPQGEIQLSKICRSGNYRNV